MKDKLRRNAKDKVFKNLLENKERLAQFYFNLTGRIINPEDIIYNTITTSLVKGKEEDVAFQIGNKYIILFEAQSTWSNQDIIRFAVYMFLLFVNYVEANEDEVFKGNDDITIPEVEAYVIYTGYRNLEETVSLDQLYSKDQKSMINAKMEITTLKNATGLVKEYIEFSRLETEYYRDNKRSQDDVLELIDYCVKNNILKDYMLEHTKEVANMIENFFTEEKRIKWLINDAVEEAVAKERQEREEENRKNQEEIKRLKEIIKNLNGEI